jgi:hypothetical protein
MGWVSNQCALIAWSSPAQHSFPGTSVPRLTMAPDALGLRLQVGQYAASLLYSALHILPSGASRTFMPRLLAHASNACFQFERSSRMTP